MSRIKSNDYKKILALPIVGKAPESEKEEKFLREVNDYVFQNIEDSGLSMQFTYGTTKNLVSISLMHGATYKFPRFLARHVEECSSPVYERKHDGLGAMSMVEIGRKPRFQMRQVYNSKV